MAHRRRSESRREVLDDQGRPIRKRIRRRREEHGLTASELARRTGISPAYVTRIEKGEKVPSEEVAVRIAKVLGDDPELYLWWVHGRHMSDPERTLEGYRKLKSSSLSDAPPAGARTPGIERWSKRLEAREDPAPAARVTPRASAASDRWGLSVGEGIEPSFLETGSMPFPVRVCGAAADPETPEWLWLDPRLLPREVDRERIVAHRLDVEHAAWLGDFETGDLVIVVPGHDDPPRADRVYLVMTPGDEGKATSDETSDERAREPVGPVRLSRVRVTGAKHLVLIPGEAARHDPEIIELSDRHGLEHWLVGKVVLAMRRGAD